MNGENGEQNLEAIKSVINQLTSIVRRIDKDDLSALAQMHGWCESLVGADTTDSASSSSPLSAGAKSLGIALEELILGEAQDPDAAFASITTGISELAKLAGRPESEDTSIPNHASFSADDQTADGHNDNGIVEKSARISEDSSPALQETSIGVEIEAGTGSAKSNESYESVPLQINEKELDFIKAFVEEASEHIESIEAAVLEVEQSPQDKAKVDNLFRPFHTIKGMAGFLNLRDINCLTHEVETLLDLGRKGKRAITTGMIDLIFDVVDILKAQISAIGSWLVEPSGKSPAQPPVSSMIDKLRAVVAGRLELDVRGPDEDYSDRKLGESLVEQGVVPKEVVDMALKIQKDEKPDKKIGEILKAMDTVTAKQISRAIRSQTQEATKASATTGMKTVGDQSIRIDTAKLDTLVDMVGELVIAQTQVNANCLNLGDPKLVKNVNQVYKIVRDVQEVAMAMRMIPIGSTFQKMARLVRDVSRKAGKKVNLTISGEETELDKNVIQQIGDPLVHMVRNAIDHGIESPEDRLVANKEETGHVHLGAYHQGGNIVIEIKDDGKGLDPEVLIAKGIEKGIVQSGEELTDQQAFGLIFAPGFSTAKVVTDISGRGVGMDVAKRNIEQLRGKIEILSEKGRGSTFLIRLPLTLAIIDGMVVRVGKERFILPTIAIEQSLQPIPEQITTVQHKGEVLNVRGKLIPLIQLGELFQMSGRVNPCAAMVVIAQNDRRQVGLVVEELIGQQQVVIKSLGERFEGQQGISGAAILGDGRVGLILEVSGIAAYNSKFVSSQHADDQKHDPQSADGEENYNTAIATENEETDPSAQATPEPVLT